MLQIRTILVPTDHSPCAERALAPAADLAARYGAALRRVHVAEAGHASEPAAAPEALGEALGVSVPVETLAASPVPPARRILDLAREADADLIVMGTHGRLGFGHHFLGNVTEKVVRLADRPVLTVPCHDVPRSGPVVAPVDFSEASREALRLASALAADRGSALHALHVVEWPTSLPPYLVGVALPALPEILERAQAELARFVADLGAAEAGGEGVVTAVRVRLGGLAASAVADYAREVAAGLVVLSTHGRTGIGRLLLGSVTERVVRLAPCPVLTVRPGMRGSLQSAASATDEAVSVAPVQAAA